MCLFGMSAPTYEYSSIITHALQKLICLWFLHHLMPRPVADAISLDYDSLCIMIRCYTAVSIVEKKKHERRRNNERCGCVYLVVESTWHTLGQSMARPNNRQIRYVIQRNKSPFRHDP